MAEPADEKYEYNLGDLVWAKVKGFNFWPARIVINEKIKVNRKIRSPRCVLFFGSEDYAMVSEESLKPYEKFREQFSNIPKKSQLFRKALEQVEEIFAEMKGTTGTTANGTTTAPETSKPPAELFKNKAKPTVSSPAPTRDYSRTPFRREKRNFELISNETDTKKSAQIKIATSNEEKKKKLSPPSPTYSAKMSPSSNSALYTNKFESVNKHEPMVIPEKMSEMKTMNKSSKSKPSSLKFGFIGLGKMGQQIVKLLIDSGHEISVWNRTPSKCKDMEKIGANVVKTPGDVVRESDITFSCLSDASAAQTIFFGNCGVAGEINATKGYVELTSMDYTVSMEIENAVKSKGGRYLEAPILICSLQKQIEEGKLVAMVSGNRSLFDDCSSCFEAICSHVYFLSENAGIASKMNIIISTYYGNMVGSLLECMTLVERFGLIHKDFVEIISHSPLNSQLIESKIPSLIDSTLVRDIPIDHIRRDLGYCLHTANQKSFTTPITASVNEVFKQKKHHYY